MEISITNISAEEFSSLIEKHFGFLINCGLRLKKTGDWSYEFESSTTKISVFTEYNTLVVGMEPVGEEARKLLRNNILPEQIGVSVVARCLNPNLDYKVIWDEPIPSAMDRESQLLKNYCTDFLCGDFSKWKLVEECRKRRR